MPTFTQAHLALADARIARKDLRGALDALQKGSRPRCRATPRSSTARARCGRQLGDRTAALAAYRRVMTLAPTTRWCAGALGETAARAWASPTEALALFREATTLDPSVADYWNSLGMVLGGDGKHDEAARAFREATTRDPKNARYAYNLGLVLQRAGKRRGRASGSRARSRSTRRSVRRANASRNWRDDAVALATRLGRGPRPRRRVAALAAATTVFWPVLANGFLNWDDLEVLVDNDALRAIRRGAVIVGLHHDPHGPLPAAVVAGLRCSGRRRPRARMHATSLALHVINVGLLVGWPRVVADRGDGADGHWWAAAAARRALRACTRCASSPWPGPAPCPTCCSYAPLLVAVGCWLQWTRGGRVALWWAALGAFAVSQLARVTAPLCRSCSWRWPASTTGSRRARRARWSARAAPFAVLVAPLASSKPAPATSRRSATSAWRRGWPGRCSTRRSICGAP